MPIKLVAPIKQATGSVKYDEPQTLTAAQQSQARDNINAADKYNGLTPVSLKMPNMFDSSKATYLQRYTNGNINLPDFEGSEETVNLLYHLYWLLESATTTYLVKDDVSGIASLVDSGAFGDNFFESDYISSDNALIIQDDPNDPLITLKIWVYKASNKTYAVRVTTFDGYKLEMGYSITDAKFIDSMVLTSQWIRRSTSKHNTNPTLSQLEMAAAPTKDMQIATKKYVDDAIKAALAQQ